MKKISCLILICLLSVMLFSDTRSESIDFFIVFDKSKSMADKIEKARAYTAQEILGRYVMTNDWVCFIEFYGTTNVLFKGPITNEQDKKRLIQSLLAIEANGRYTDIGNALDVLRQEVIARGHPERSKYILLITDLRQEAPPQSKYQSTDYSISHPALEYVLKKEIDGFYLITVGLTIENKAHDLAEYVINTLTQLPERNFEQIPGATDSTHTTSADTTALQEKNLKTTKQFSQTSTILLVVLVAFIAAVIVFFILFIQKRKSEIKEKE